MWQAIIDFFNYPIINWWSTAQPAQEAVEATETTPAIPAVDAVPSELVFQFSMN